MILDQEKIDYKNKTRSRLGLGITKNKAISRRFDENMDENKRDLVRFSVMWEQMYSLRTIRKRCRDFKNGDQWGDTFYDPDTRKYVRGDDYIRAQGRVPLVQNLVNPVIKNLKGQYRSFAMKGVVTSRVREKQMLGYTMSAALDAELSANQSEELDAQNLEEMSISGICVSKLQWDYDETQDKECLLISNPIINRMIFNNDIEDIRFTKSIRAIGEIHDWPIDKIVQMFANTKKEENDIRSMFPITIEEFQSRYRALSSDRIDNLSFLMPEDFDKGRVFELWQKKLVWRMRVHDPVDASIQVVDMTEKELEEINQRRINNYMMAGVPETEYALLDWQIKPEQVWYVKFLTAWGQCLFEKENPYKHQSHPYVITVDSMIDGKVSSLIESMIPLQVSINRMITMRDFIIGNSAKGLLMVPEGSIPAGVNINDFASEWTKANGVIVYKALATGAKPEQISTNSVPVGINEQISLSMSLFFQVSGISQALQGQQAGPGTPASLYAQEAQNSTVNVKDFMARFTSHKIERDFKAIQLIQQFKNDQYYISVAGKDIPQEARVYDPEQIKSVKFDYAITESQDTPVFRQAMDAELMKLLQMQAIDVKLYLEQSSMPWADRLLDAISKRESTDQSSNMQNIQEASAQGEQQAVQNSDPRAVALLKQAVSAPQGHQVVQQQQ